MQEAFNAFFRFTDYVMANFWHIVWSVVILMIVWALVKSLLGTIITDTADILRKAFGRPQKGSKKKKAKAEEAPAIAEPQAQPIMVAHPLDIKDEASRRLFEEEVEKEKERMRMRANTQ